MQVRFLLGPAGSGKTFRCLAEIRAALAQTPEGPPLVLLAPKQATFQLERQMLGGEDLSAGRHGGRRSGPESLRGFTRLHVLSFDRLAEFVFERLNVAPPKLLSGEGRLMVLRALLRRHDGEMKLLRGSARRPGFAQELGGQLAELQQHQFGSARLRALGADAALRRELRDKLHDLALLSEKYAEWLQVHVLQDANCLHEVAGARLAEARRRGDAEKMQSAGNLQPRGGGGEQLADRVVGAPNSGSQQLMLQLPLFPGPRPRHSPLVIGHLWMDGFAEMTPQEHALLAAIMPFCQGATLAFCLETEPTPARSWLSIWSAIGKTFQRCRDQLAAVPGCEVRTEILKRAPGANRFPEGSALEILEAGWALPAAAPEIEIANLKSQISVTACGDPEAEAVFAARELLKFVRQDGGNRFRDCAVLVRNLEHYHQPLARTFRRYEIPFFLDRRENVTHHPLAELTRSALRTVAFGWQPDDWFATLKAGFTPVPEPDLDRLENMALEFGWHGARWFEPLTDEYCERLRKEIFPPFERFYRRLQPQKLEPTGAQLAEAIGELWEDLRVGATLGKWSLPETLEKGRRDAGPGLHQTVYEQMVSWAENVALAFPREPLPLRDWLPVLEAGLAGLTVGVIPPALDEVLVGAIDRARNPDLKFALLLGVNESIFPALPAASVILTNADREELDGQNAGLGPNVFDQISRERYLGYIACTRAREKLAVTFCRQDAAGRTLNPSPFIAHLQRNFPQLEIEEFSGAMDWRMVEHAGELAGEMVRLGNLERRVGAPGLPCGGLVGERVNLDDPHPLDHQTREGCFSELLKIPALKVLAEKVGQLREPEEAENLSPALAARVYGAVLKSSVSRLEEFAQCPFRFFIHSGLHAEERKKFELDARERGSFQHEILKEFHDELTAEKKRWRDITPTEARERIGRIAAGLAPLYREGLLWADDQSRFTARALTAALQNFVATLVEWMRTQYEFDPVQAETGFGLDDSGLPAWQIDLGNGHALALRGRVDRIDVHHEGDRSLVVVMDYKSGVRKLDKIFIAHGVQLQLLAYLAAVRRWPAEFLGARRLVPAGVFYVKLRGQFESGASRAEVLADPDTARRLAFQHRGRFDVAFVNRLDRVQAHDQFRYKLNKDGSTPSKSSEALSCKEFTALLDQVEAQLRSHGEKIYAGVAAVDPYRKGSATPCVYCDYRSVCRIDEWTHEFRELRDSRLPNDNAR